MGAWLIAIRGRPVLRDGTEKTDPVRQLSGKPTWFNNLDPRAFRHGQEVLSVDDPPPSAAEQEALRKRGLSPATQAAIDKLQTSDPRRALECYTDGELRLECLDRNIDPSSMAGTAKEPGAGRKMKIDALLRAAGYDPTPEPPRYPAPTRVEAPQEPEPAKAPKAKGR